MAFPLVLSPVLLQVWRSLRVLLPSCPSFSSLGKPSCRVTDKVTFRRLTRIHSPVKIMKIHFAEEAGIEVHTYTLMPPLSITKSHKRAISFNTLSAAIPETVCHLFSFFILQICLFSPGILFIPIISPQKPRILQGLYGTVHIDMKGGCIEDTGKSVRTN
jgi:hypothetical protein